MNKLSKYNEFIIEKEFTSLLNNISMLSESETLKVGDTMEWDMNKKDDEKPIEFEWDIEKQKKGIKDYLNNSLNSNIFKKIKDFISKLDTKDQIKKYFDKLVSELKHMPNKVKKDLFVKISLLIISTSSLPINELITDKDSNNNTLLSEVRKELLNRKENKENKVIEVNKLASFDIANNLISFAEGGYTENKVDGGNYTSGPSKKSGYLIGTNHGIAAFTLIATDIKPTTDKEIRLLKQCYGNKYSELCGKDIPSFSEQWKLDQKHIRPKDIAIKWKNIMKGLSKETATKIYKNEYWEPQGFSNFKNQSIANILYDACVNQGPRVAKRVLIKSLNELGYKVDDVNKWTDVHNKLTPIVNSMSLDKLKILHDEIKSQRINQYKNNADADEIAEFSKGWDNRLLKKINKFKEDIS